MSYIQVRTSNANKIYLRDIVQLMFIFILISTYVEHKIKLNRNTYF